VRIMGGEAGADVRAVTVGGLEGEPVICGPGFGVVVTEKSGLLRGLVIGVDDVLGV
jgi:hypothetical protein